MRLRVLVRCAVHCATPATGRAQQHASISGHEHGRPACCRYASCASASAAQLSVRMVLLCGAPQALRARRVQRLCRQSEHRRLAAMTSASNAEGRQFNPGQVYDVRFRQLAMPFGAVGAVSLHVDRPVFKISFDPRSPVLFTSTDLSSTSALKKVQSPIRPPCHPRICPLAFATSTDPPRNLCCRCERQFQGTSMGGLHVAATLLMLLRVLHSCLSEWSFYVWHHRHCGYADAQSTCGLAAMTPDSHAERRQLDPGQVYIACVHLTCFLSCRSTCLQNLF